jgi:hypothetical protein
MGERSGSFLLALKGAWQEDNLLAAAQSLLLGFRPDASSFFSLALPGSPAAKKRRAQVREPAGLETRQILPWPREPDARVGLEDGTVALFQPEGTAARRHTQISPGATYPGSFVENSFLPSLKSAKRWSSIASSYEGDGKNTAG